MRQFICFALILGAAPCAAQVIERGTVGLPAIEARLFPLQYMEPSDAAKLVAPFVAPGSAMGVFEAGGSVRAIVVKASPAMLVRVDSVLKAMDRMPMTVVLRFQLIAAIDTAVRDPNVPSDVESSLRGLFRFEGYRLLAEGTATATGRSSFEVTMSASSVRGGRDTYEERFVVSGSVWRLSASVGSGGTGTSSAQLDVTLKDWVPPVIQTASNGDVKRVDGSSTLLHTGLTVPLGQTVVLGSAAASSGRRALILTLRPVAQQSPGGR